MRAPCTWGLFASGLRKRQRSKIAAADTEEDFQHAMDFSPAMFEDEELSARIQDSGLHSGGQNQAASGRDDTSHEGQEGNSDRNDNSGQGDNFAEDGGLSQNDNSEQERVEGFRAPGDAANTGELLKFLLDRTGYIKLLEQEDTPESLARIENLRELVNAAMDSRDRGESLSEFLDHAALVSDADHYDENARVTLMTLHAAKGLEFPLVFLVGLEEGLFPHSRTLLAPDDIEEERRLCYVGMTRAMDTLVLSRARYRRRYGTDMPEASVPSRFLEEVPEELLQDLGSPRSCLACQQRLRQQPALCLRRRGPAAATRTPQYSAAELLRRANIQLHRQHCGIFRLAGQEVHAAKDRGNSAERADRISSRAAGAPSEIWRRYGVQARG